LAVAVGRAGGKKNQMPTATMVPKIVPMQTANSQRRQKAFHRVSAVGGPETATGVGRIRGSRRISMARLAANPLGEGGVAWASGGDSCWWSGLLKDIGGSCT
jgi:hypothetical protein